MKSVKEMCECVMTATYVTKRVNGTVVYLFTLRGKNKLNEKPIRFRNMGSRWRRGTGTGRGRGVVALVGLSFLSS